MSILVTDIFSGFLSELEEPAELSRKLRRADDFIRLAVVATCNIMGTADEELQSDDMAGLFLASSFGPMETNFDVLGKVVNGDQVSPTLFSHSVFNAAAGYIASVFKITGCSITVTDFGFPFFRALQQGMVALQSGRLSSCLVLQVETYSQLLHDARQEFDQTGVLWQPGVVCWQLKKNYENNQKSSGINGLEIQSASPAHDSYLKFHEKTTLCSIPQEISDPLGSAMSITAAIAKGNIDEGLKCRIDSNYGVVTLNFG